MTSRPDNLADGRRSGNVHDTTPWTAYVSGDPVRLVE